MVNLRKDTHGPNSMSGLNVAVLAYDRSVAKNKETGEISSHYLDARLHPDDARAAGQSTLALVSEPDPKSRSGYNNSKPYAASQFAEIQKAAGDNVAPLLTKDGTEVGKIYGVKVDGMVRGKGLVMNTKTLQPSEMSVQPTAEGDIQKRIFDSQSAAKEAKAQSKAQQAEGQTQEQTAQAEAPAVEQVEQQQADEPGLG